jgi:hypothetical protein
MSVNGGGGHTRGASFSKGRNGSLAGTREITEEDLEAYSHGIQVIDENKEFTYVICSEFFSRQNIRSFARPCVASH